MKNTIIQLNLYVLITGFTAMLLLSGGCGQRNGGVPVSAAAKTTLPGNPRAYAQGSGNCSASFEHDYNTVVMSINSSVEDFQKIEGLINEFSKKYGDARCQTSLRPEDKLDAIPATIDVNVKTTEWKNLVTNLLEKSEKIDPVDPAHDVSFQALSIPVKLEVLDAEKMNLLLAAGGPNYIQNGKIVFKGMDNGTNFCGFVMQKSLTVKVGDLLPLQNLDQKNADLTAHSNDGILVMLCHRRRGNTEWKVKNLDLIFRGIAKIEI